MSLEVVPIVPNQIGGEFVYSAKFLCGTIQRSPAGAAGGPLLPGTYETAINIHNPNPGPDQEPYKVDLTKRAILTPAQTKEHGERTAGRGVAKHDWLYPDEGFEVDCDDIRNNLLGGNTTPFIKGFVVIRSPKILDVVAVYTSTA